MPSWRSARFRGDAPDSRPTVAPVASSAMPTSTVAVTIAAVPSRPKIQGSTGMSAPDAKNRKLEIAADRAGADRLVVMRGDRERVGRRRHPAGGLHARHDERGLLARLLLVHAAGAVDERELVRVDVEVDERLAGGRVGGGCLEQLALRPHRHVLARAHRERAGEEARDAGEEHDGGGHAGRADAEHEREVRDEPVVGAEHGRAEGAGETASPARREPAHDLAVDALVGRHRRGGIGVARVRRAGLGALCEREHEDRAESARERAEDAGAHVGTRHSRVVTAEQGEPVRLVAPLGRGECEQDLALLAVAARGELAVDRRFGSLVGEVSTPSRPVGRGRGRCSSLILLHILIGSRGRSPGGYPLRHVAAACAASATISARLAASGRFTGIGSISERRTAATADGQRASLRAR